MRGAYLRTLTSCTAAWFVAQMSYYAQAQMLGPVMSHYGVGEIQVGLVFTKELTIYALGSLFFAGPLSRISRARAALAGGVLLIAVNLVSASTDNFEVLRVTRMLAGFAGGLIGASGTASAASSDNPQRIFAVLGVSWGLIAAVQLFLMPYVTVPFGPAGGYYGMAAAVAVFMPLFVWLNPPVAGKSGDSASRSDAGRSMWGRLARRLGVRDAPNGRYAVPVMAALFIYEIGQGATQVFLEQFGLRAGLEQYRIGQILGVAGSLGLTGGLLAAWMGNRFGNLRPIVSGVVFNIVFASTLALGTVPSLFALSYLGWNVAYYFLVPFMLGVLAQMDRRGRWAVAAEAVWWLGAAPGAAVGGMLVEKGGYPALAALAPFAGFSCLSILVLAIRRFNANRTETGLG